MASRALGPEDRQHIDRILGYMNFSCGSPDPQFLASCNELFVFGEQEASPWRAFLDLLRAELPRLQQSSATFSDISQAQALLRVLRDGLLPAYRHFHADLLFHQREEVLFRPFFLGRACESLLQQGPPWQETTRIVEGAISQLNDYIGYRPVAALESRRHEPYEHEWVRPLPLYIEGAGVEYGRHREVVTLALEILAGTHPDILRAACFDPQALSELAVDPRAYDFDHPVNKRPNYHFGQWDPHCIDNQGRYRRYVVQDVTLQALMARLDEEQSLPPEELLFEAAGVLAGTMLMGAGISGSGPDTHDSSVTLSNLLVRVAAYRDAFYEELIERTSAAHRRRLAEESLARHQPFGGARQHLNAWLSRRRASQLERVQLARIFARMGYPEAAARQAAVVPAASARMRCEIDCWLAAGDRAVEQGELELATALAGEIFAQLNRAIECGAVVDPWNILGFDARFSLFPALENSVHDHRADELVELMDALFELYSRIWGAAAAEDRSELCEQVRGRFAEITAWWRQYAAHEVSSVDAVDPQEVFQAAQHVAECLNLWHKGGAEAGDVRFWAAHADMFDSPRAYSLVVDALLERQDFVATMALLIHWLSQAEHVPLERADGSFHELSQQWLMKLLGAAPRRSPQEQAAGSLVRKFFDFIEANADQYWRAPQFELGNVSASNARRHVDEDEDYEDGEAQLYSAAYEEVVYCDSTDDGVDGELYETDETSSDELSTESTRISDRLAFLSSLARLWKIAAVGQRFCRGKGAADDEQGPFDCMATMRHWVHDAIENHKQLIRLLETVLDYRIRTLGTDPEALQQYDRLRLIKDSLLDRIATTCVDLSTTCQLMLASLAAQSHEYDEEITVLASEFGEEAAVVVQVMAAVMRGDHARIRELWPTLCHTLADRNCCMCRSPRREMSGRSWPPAADSASCATCWPGCRGADCGWKRAS